MVPRLRLGWLGIRVSCGPQNMDQENLKIDEHSNWGSFILRDVAVAGLVGPQEKVKDP